MTRSVAALFCFAVCMAYGQNEADALLQHGVSLAKQRKWEEAASVLHEGETLFPTDPRFPVELAGLAYREKNERAAKRYLKGGLDLAPRDAYANDFLGTLYFEDGNLAAALRPWNRIGKPVVGDVVFVPALPIDTLLRERTVPLSPGQMLTRQRFLEVTDNLEHLQILSNLSLQLVARQGEEDRYDLVIRSVPVGEPLSGWLGRILPYVRELPYQAVAPDFLNIGHHAIDVWSLWRWDANKRGAFLYAEAPWRENPRIHQEYKVVVRDEVWSIPGVARPFYLRMGAASGGLDFSLSPQLHWYAGLQLEDRTYARAPGSAAFMNGFSASIQNRIEEDWLHASSRLSGRNFAALSAGHFSGSRLIETRIGTEAHWLPGARQHNYELSLEAQAGEVFGPAPLDQQFDLAMERDTEEDLWLRGIVGTTNSRKGNGPIGKSYALAQTDLQRKIFEIPFIRVSAGPFFDIGAIGQPLSAGAYRGVLYDTGLEAHVRTVGSTDVLLVYGRNLTNGGNAFYTAVRRILDRRQ